MLKCKIISFNKIQEYDNLESIILPCVSGEIEVLPGYAESFMLLKQGRIILTSIKKQKDILNIRKAQCHIKNNELVIIE